MLYRRPRVWYRFPDFPLDERLYIDPEGVYRLRVLCARMSRGGHFPEDEVPEKRRSYIPVNYEEDARVRRDPSIRSVSLLPPALLC
jgi:hypothetical protein